MIKVVFGSSLYLSMVWRGVNGLQVAKLCCGEIVTRGQAYRLTFSTASATAGGGCAFSELSPPTNSPCQPLTVFIPRTLDVQAAVSSSCSFRSYDDDYDDEDDDDNDAEDAVAAKAVKEKEKTAFRPSRLIIWSKDRTTRRQHVEE
ncbi:hypothetical protein V1477_020613 [Vespula maculifrons]|uniref:Uncharacterized protein n=1 Tax=Vespula maculifrons TaxID=7453 RepID=A0ABD2AME4_VESMC